MIHSGSGRIRQARHFLSARGNMCWRTCARRRSIGLRWPIPRRAPGERARKDHAASATPALAVAWWLRQRSLMRSYRMAAATAGLVSFSCVVCASCLESPELPTNEPSASGEGLRLRDTEPTEQSLMKVFCKKEQHGAPCSEMCNAAGIGCVYGALHPNKPEGGVGLLYACNSLFPGFMCSYTYPNGDSCHFPFGRPGLALCMYTGGAE